jgi:hypothetical protein
MFPQEGDGEAVVRNPVIGKDTQFPAGSGRNQPLPPPRKGRRQIG